MAIQDLIYQLEGTFSSPGVVLVAFTVLIFVIIFEVLTKVAYFKDQKGTAIFVSLVISLLAVYYLNSVYYAFLTINLLIFLLVVIIIFFVARAFFRLNKRQFRR